MLRKLKILFCGFCMGTADLVPGISGGTIAFISGFYEELLHNIETVASRRWRQCSWAFLLTLGLGMLLAIATLSPFIHRLLNHPIHRSYLFAGFFGFILASTQLCIKQVQVWRWRQIAVLFFGASLGLGLALLPASSRDEGRYAVSIDLETHGLPVANYDTAGAVLYDVDAPTLAAMVARGIIPPSANVEDRHQQLVASAETFVKASHAPQFFQPWVLFAGALAVSAMLLPGVSGSYILNVMGLYTVAIAALADTITALKLGELDTHALSFLCNLGLGILLGALSFARVLSWMFRLHRSYTLAALIGFMLGALRSIWPFWSYSWVFIPMKLERGAQLVALEPTGADFWTSLIALAIGCTSFATVIIMGRWQEGQRPRQSLSSTPQ